MQNRSFKRTALTATLLSLALTSQLAQAQSTSQDGPWLVRLRATYLDSVNKDSTGLDLSINDKVIPDLNISYFFTPEWASELVLTYPQKQRIESGGTRIGSLKHLPPTLTLQYHFTSVPYVTPYIGAGVNYTRFSSVSFEPAVQAALHPSIDKNSFGLAAQIGFDVQIAPTWSANFDLKRVQIRTDVSSAGSKVGEFKVDPWLIGIGVGKRF